MLSKIKDMANFCATSLLVAANYLYKQSQQKPSKLQSSHFWTSTKVFEEPFYCQTL